MNYTYNNIHPTIIGHLLELLPFFIFGLILLIMSILPNQVDNNPIDNNPIDNNPTVNNQTIENQEIDNEID